MSTNISFLSASEIKISDLIFLSRADRSYRFIIRFLPFVGILAGFAACVVYLGGAA